MSKTVYGIPIEFHNDGKKKNNSWTATIETSWWEAVKPDFNVFDIHVSASVHAATKQGATRDIQAGLQQFMQFLLEKESEAE